MAIGKLFDIQGDSIIPKQDCFIIQPIKAVIDKFPQDHPKILAFLHYMKSMRPDDNPYADVPEESKAEQIMYDLKLDIDVEDEIIKDALQCVEEKYSTPSYRVYRGMQAAFDNIGNTLFTAQINLGGRDANVQNITKLMKEYEAIRKNLKQAYKDFEEEQGDTKVRGGGTLADDEDKDY